MERTPRRWWEMLTGEGRAWSLRHPTDVLRHLRFLARLRRNKAGADALAQAMLSEWDRGAFVERMRPYWDPFPTKGASKYLDLDHYLADSAGRCFSLGLFDDGRTKRVLDLGCGPGYFLGLCRTLGHDVVGVDVADEPLYTELIEFQGIPRSIHMVTPASPLPPLDGRFDVVSAFGVTFNYERGRKGTSWSADEWMRAIHQFLEVLAPDGTIVIKFNEDPRTGQLYPSGLRSRLAREPGTDTKFFGEHLLIRRTEMAAAGDLSDPPASRT